MVKLNDGRPVRAGIGNLPPLTAAFVARMLGYSRWQIGIWVKNGVLHPTIDPRTGRRVFLIEEIEQIRAHLRRVKRRIPELSEGELAAEVFCRFDRGESAREIVKGLCVHPDRVEELYEVWAEPDLAKRRKTKQRADEEAKEQAKQKALDKSIKDMMRRPRRDDE